MSDRHTPKSQPHLSPEEIVNYIDQTNTDADRRRVEGHLAECETCLHEVIEVKSLLRGRL